MTVDQALTILYIVLAIGFIVLVAYLSRALDQLTKVLKNVEETSATVNKMASAVESAATEGVLPAVQSISSTVSKLVTIANAFIPAKKRKASAKDEE